MDAWEAGRDLALVKEAEEAAQEDAWGTQHNWKFELEMVVRKCNAMLKSCRMCAIVRMITDCGPGSLYRPTEKYSKTG